VNFTFAAESVYANVAERDDVTESGPDVIVGFGVLPFAAADATPASGPAITAAMVATDSADVRPRRAEVERNMDEPP
jgi:hypothetical protein